MKIILVDDEALLLEDLAISLARYSDIEISATFTDPKAALAWLQINKVDVAVLDISMPGLNGLDLARMAVEAQPQLLVVFLTAYEGFAVQAFEQRAFDYLLKPLSDKRLDQTVYRLRENLANRPIEQPLPKAEIFVRFFGRFEVFVNKQPLRWRSRKCQELIAYLLSRSGCSAPKYCVAEALFPETEEKNAALNTQSTVSRARQSFADAGLLAQIVYSDDSYRLIMPKYRSDVEEIEQLLANSDVQRDLIQSLAAAGYLGLNDFYWAEKQTDWWAERIAIIVN